MQVSRTAPRTGGGLWRWRSLPVNLAREDAILTFSTPSNDPLPSDEHAAECPVGSLDQRTDQIASRRTEQATRAEGSPVACS